MKLRAYWLLPLIVVGCMESQKPDPLPRRPSLYTRLGGEAKMEQIVDGFVERAAAAKELPPPIREAFAQEDNGALKVQLVRRLAAALGGPYPGTLVDLQQVFTSLDDKVTTRDMTLLVGMLDKAMADAGCRADDRKAAMTTLAPLGTMSAGAEE
jgi:truncated hemoglobin YjbI